MFKLISKPNTNEEDFIKFKNREIKAKSIFYIKEINKPLAYMFVKEYHYLKDAKFFCIQAFGLFCKKNDELVGVAAYSLPQGTNTLNGWFGLDVDNKDIYELARLCLLPTLNGTNATSFLLGGSIKELKKQGVVRAVITLATSDRHVGSIYQVCNFKYYGLTDIKCDFYLKSTGEHLQRGPSHNIHGCFVQRPQKHRYAYILDPTLEVLYPEQERPKQNDIITEKGCCHGTNIVYDNRFGEYYTCPKCTGKLKFIRKDGD